MIRYIGKTKNVKGRYIQHLTPYSLSQPSRKAQWIKELLAQGVKPTVGVLEEVGIENWEERERFYIAHYRSLGFDLVNERDGGQCGITADQREKINEKLRGRKLSKSHIEAISKANTGRTHTKEAIERMSAAHIGKKMPPVVAVKLRAAFHEKSDSEKAAILERLRAPKSIEAREKMSVARRGKALSEETRKKIAEKSRQQWSRIKASRMQQQSCLEPVE